MDESKLLTPDTSELQTAIAKATAELHRAKSVEELFEIIGETFEYCAWKIHGSVMSLAWDNWVTVDPAFPHEELKDGLIVHMDSSIIPPFLLHQTGCYRIDRDSHYEKVVDTLRTIDGDRLSPESAARVLGIERGTSAAMGPLFISDEPWGMMAVAWRDPSPSHLELFSLFFQDVGAAMERVTTKRGGTSFPTDVSESGRQRLRLLRFLSDIGRISSTRRLERRELLSEILREARTALGFDLAWGAFVGDDSDIAPEWEDQDLVGNGASLQAPIVSTLRRAADRLTSSGHPIVEETKWKEETAHLCAIPLRTPTALQGVIALLRREHPITDQELETLEAAGSTLGFAMEHAKRFRQAQKSLSDLELLLDVGQAITGTPELKSTLNTAAEIITRLIDASHAFILVLDEHSGVLEGIATSNEAWRESFSQVRIDLSEDTLAPRAITTRAPVVVFDVDEAPWVSKERATRYREKSLLAVPMLLLGEPIGCIVVADSRGPRAWHPREIERVTLIAHQVAIATANSRHYEKLISSNRELAKTQEELLKKERLAALGELSAVVAHEVRNPLGVIFNSLTSLKRLLRPEGDAEVLLGIMEEESNRLNEIVGDLLEFAKPNPLEPQLEDVGRLVLDSVRSTLHGPDVAVEVDIAEGLPPSLVDGRFLRQALLNLLENAVQSMPRGGTVHIDVGIDEATSPAFIEIRITDEGVGIPEELFDKIFDPFFTTKATGSGLGLALVKRIVDAHRGQLTLESRRGGGTTFVVRLEAAKE